jgi:hypothetical protein
MYQVCIVVNDFIRRSFMWLDQIYSHPSPNFFVILWSFMPAYITCQCLLFDRKPTHVVVLSARILPLGSKVILPNSKSHGYLPTLTSKFQWAWRFGLARLRCCQIGGGGRLNMKALIRPNVSSFVVVIYVTGDLIFLPKLFSCWPFVFTTTKPRGMLYSYFSSGTSHL